MCVVSMIMDHTHEEWNPRRWKMVPEVVPIPDHLKPPPPVTREEIEEFRRLLERAREYDRRHNEPDCELEEKRQKLRDLAKELGVEIDFV